jgi:3-hydroxyisobutyrate dehydrogenase
MARIGFIGLGNMGGPMARNLLKGGHDVKAFDLVPDLIARIVKDGAVAATSPADAAREAEVVVTMLPAGQHMREVYLGAGHVLESAAPGTLLIDSSTIDVETARAVGAAAAAANRMMIDAPVSGGTAGAAAATLTFMVGGPPEAFAAAQQFLEVMGKTVVYAGGAGNGQAAKICNNMILGISMIAVSEAFALAEKLGLEPQKLFDIASKSSGQCWSLTSYCPVPGPVPSSPANRGYKAGFTAAMMLKDLRLSQEAATKTAALTPLGAAATGLYSRYTEGGYGGSDFSGIIRHVRALAGK